jgi:HD-like signal output (HDOD) protein
VETTQQVAFDFVKTLGQELARKEFDLPPFPDVALRVRDALKNPNVSIDEITRIVVAEPILATRLLRLANSALMRRGTMEITDLKMAVHRLGFKMVQNAAMSLALEKCFTAPPGSAMRGLIEKTRKHSIRVCALAYILAKRQREAANPDEAMLAGLVHDIGVFYILTRVGDFPTLFGDEQSLNELLVSWHAGVGKAILESWGFPEHLVAAVDEHEVLDREHLGPPDMTDILVAANVIERFDESENPPPLAEVAACRRLCLDDKRVGSIIAQSEQEIRSIDQALGG